VRATVLKDVGGFDETLAPGEDWDWLSRAMDMGVPMELLPEVLLVKRVRPGSLSTEATRGKQNLLRLLRASLQRKREARASHA
jgi:hypothetical protein